jgi:hypothetical protein
MLVTSKNLAKLGRQVKEDDAIKIVSHQLSQTKILFLNAAHSRRRHALQLI